LQQQTNKTKQQSHPYGIALQNKQPGHVIHFNGIENIRLENKWFFSIFVKHKNNGIMV
jgi:hypothetical protein